jgi:predicted lipoprotein with Yx(FWY)xxD motif
MSPSLRVPFRTLLAATVGGVLIVAGCTVGSPGGGSPSAGTSVPSATSTPAATSTASGGGGGYGGDDYSTAKPAATPAATAATSPAAVTYEIDVAQSASLGAYLTGEDGKTLYTYKPDTATASNCNGTCAQNWPPFILEANEQATRGAGVAGALATITRADGTAQVTYAGHPVYYYGGDAAAGDTNGEGIGGVWHVVKP